MRTLDEKREQARLRQIRYRKLHPDRKRASNAKWIREHPAESKAAHQRWKKKYAGLLKSLGIDVQ